MHGNGVVSSSSSSSGSNGLGWNCRGGRRGAIFILFAVVNDSITRRDGSEEARRGSQRQRDRRRRGLRGLRFRVEVLLKAHGPRGSHGEGRRRGLRLAEVSLGLAAVELVRALKVLALEALALVSAVHASFEALAVLLQAAALLAVAARGMLLVPTALARGLLYFCLKRHRVLLQRRLDRFLALAVVLVVVEAVEAVAVGAEPAHRKAVAVQFQAL
mmetsp:Transcript_34758/g.69032  ORF Transcript_34758/g.69032 Transcript_34758/m.69032 type:complete len:216 (+) Transcript_34758:620-1267(+)